MRSLFQEELELISEQLVEMSRLSARALDRVLFKLGRPPRQQLRMADGRVRAAPYLPLAEKWTGSWAPRALKIRGE